MHGGTAQPGAPAGCVKVNSQAVVTQSDIYTVGGCPFNVSGAPVPCVTAQWIMAATRVTSNGIPVILQDSQAVCAPNGTGVNIILTQTRVTAT
jgi:uncharacterized Zn-binding protein involved in type VI secretion